MLHPYVSCLPFCLEYRIDRGTTRLIGGGNCFFLDCFHQYFFLLAISTGMSELEVVLECQVTISHS